MPTYSLCDVVYYNGTIGVPVVHGRERLVALLASRVPDLELDCGGLVEGDGLGEECGADGRLPVVIELVLHISAAVGPADAADAARKHTFTKRSTSEDYVLLAPFPAALQAVRTFPTADSPA
jgi:hypothetical protein